ncbi:MAG: hypothetical protein WBW33_14430 [Bryobacteraceae bacterium]
MRLSRLRGTTAFFLSLSLSLLASPGENSIGTVTNLRDTASRNVPQASGICASAAGSQVTLDGGSKIWLAPGARGTFYRDRLELESGGANMQLTSGFEVRVNNISFRADGYASAAILMLGSGHTALAVRSGTVSVASGGVVIAPAVRVGQSLEFAMAQSQSSGSMPGPGGNGNRPGNVGANNCRCNICLGGTITIKAGKIYLKDDLTGATIELNPGPGVPAPANGAKVTACINVTTKAGADNTGMVGTVPLFGPPAANVVNVVPWCGVIIKDKDGKYWSVNGATGLRVQLNPGISKGQLSQWLAKGKKGESLCLNGMVLSPNKDRSMPAFNPNVCFEGKIKIEGKGKDQLVYVIDDTTGAQVRIVNPNVVYPANRKDGFRVKVCGYITTPANPNANSGTAITLMPGTRVNEIGNLRKPDPIRSVTGTVTKDKDGTYWVTDPVTGLRFEIIADADEKKELDKVLDKDVTITGTVKPPAAGKSHPTIEKPKVLALGGGAEAGGTATGAGPAGGGGGAVVSIATGSTAVLLVGLVALAETNSTSSATSP